MFHQNRVEPTNGVDRGGRQGGQDEMNVRGLHHVQITIPRGNEDEGRRFYCGVLDFAAIPKPSTLEGRGGFWLQAGHSQVHVGTEDDVDRSRSKAHLAYEVDDLEGWRERLRERGIDIFDSVPILGHERFEFRDPFGNRIEFIHPVG